VKRVDVTVLSSLSELKTFQTKEAKTYAPEQTEVCSRSEEVQLQFMNCKNVQKDITLNKLFHTCQH
jgi:hypothetical protein